MEIVYERTKPLHKCCKPTDCFIYDNSLCMLMDEILEDKWSYVNLENGLHGYIQYDELVTPVKCKIVVVE